MLATRVRDGAVVRKHLQPFASLLKGNVETALARQQRTPEAAEAARRALRIAPNYAEAAELLRILSSGEGQ